MMRARLGFAAEVGFSSWQQLSADPNSVRNVEVDIVEAVAVGPRLPADIDGPAVEISRGVLGRDLAQLPSLATRLFGLARYRPWIPVARDVAQCQIQRRHGSSV